MARVAGDMGESMWETTRVDGKVPAVVILIVKFFHLDGHETRLLLVGRLDPLRSFFRLRRRCRLASAFAFFSISRCRLANVFRFLAMIAFLASSLPDSHGQESPEKSLTNSARKSLTQSGSDVRSKRIHGGIFGSDCLVSGI
jgi:hypothetical protein